MISSPQPVASLATCKWVLLGKAVPHALKTGMKVKVREMRTEGMTALVKAATLPAMVGLVPATVATTLAKAMATAEITIIGTAILVVAVGEAIDRKYA